MPQERRMLPEPPPRSLLIRTSDPVRSSPDTLRELIAILFRNRRVVEITFLATLAGAALAVALFGLNYEADTQILVRHRRVDDVVSTDASSREQTSSSDVPTEREINTEISLLRSQDLLASVVKDLHLDQHEDHFWDVLFPWRNEQWRLAKATRMLSNGLKIGEVPQSNVIHISYRSANPALAAQILSDLDKQYLAKHLAVYRPAGVFDFFHQQAQHYQQELEQQEQQLASYDLEKNAADPELEKEILVRKAGEFEGGLHETQSAMAEAEKRIKELQAELSRTPDHLTTQVTSGDNPQLLANLKSTLQELETRRTDLLTKYQPTYRLVKEVDKQIAQLQAAIAAEGQNPVKQVSSNENPTYLLLQAELVKANTDLKGYAAKSRATAPVVEAYKQQALAIDQKGIQRQDLLRNIKAADQDYMLYVQKQEQARISDELDKGRILNVAVAEAPVAASFPVYSPWLLILAGVVVALMLSMAAAFISDYIDPTFRTPDEVDAVLGLPLLACFAKGGQPPRFGFLPAGGPHLSRPIEGAEAGGEPLLLLGEEK